MSIDELPASGALERLREARQAVKASLTDKGGEAPFAEVVHDLRAGGFGEYDTRLAIASLGVRYTNVGNLVLRR